MCCTWEGLPGVKRVGLLAVRGVLVSSAVLFCLPSLADLPSLPVVPQPIAWVSGPATANLGSEADLKVPVNYSFTEASGARAFLEGMRTPVPKGLVGILQPNSGGWWVTFEYSESGFVKENEKDQLDPDAILKSFSPGRSASQVTWEIKPVYDAAQHSLEWAVRTEGGSEKGPVIKHTVRLLGRRGVLDAVVTRSGRDAAVGVMKARGTSASSLDGSRDSSGLSALKGLANGISFKDGQSYADYKQGDKVAAFGLSSLLSGSLAAAGGDAAGRTEASGGARAFWIGLLAVLLVGVGASVLLIKKLSRQRSLAPVTRASALVVAEKPLAAPAPVPAVNGSKSRHAEKAKPALKNSNNNHHGRGRRKVFNYAKFYTEMVLQGPAPVIGVETNGYELDLNRLSLQVEAPKAPDGTTVLNVNSELIAHQKAIIEEQKRLIQEQGKLIDEKTRLISEKNQLLQRQSDLIDNNLV